MRLTFLKTVQYPCLNCEHLYSFLFDYAKRLELHVFSQLRLSLRLKLAEKDEQLFFDLLVRKTCHYESDCVYADVSIPVIAPVKTRTSKISCSSFSANFSRTVGNCRPGLQPVTIMVPCRLIVCTRVIS